MIDFYTLKEMSEGFEGAGMSREEYDKVVKNMPKVSNDTGRKVRVIAKLDIFPEAELFENLLEIIRECGEVFYTTQNEPAWRKLNESLNNLLNRKKG